MQDRRLLVSSNDGIIANGSLAQPLDVLFSKSDESELVIIRGQENWPDSGWIPIGIVVVPGEHDRYSDGSCGVMSLREPYYGNPESGYSASDSNNRTDDYIYWGGGDEPTSRYNFAARLIVTDNCTYNYQKYQGLSYQRMTNGTMTSNQNCYVAWPYKSNQGVLSANTDYSNNGIYPYVSALGGRAGCDFNGVRNTAEIYIAKKNNGQWTANTIPNSNGTNSTTAAACAARFKTLGTKSFLDMFSDITTRDSNHGTPDSTRENKGFWYLPALGELSYILRFSYSINQVILSLNQKYGLVGQPLAQRQYWSSSEVATSSSEYQPSVYVANTSEGCLKEYFKDSLGFIRAFLRF